jgi:carboxyl-terminal processing protease
MVRFLSLITLLFFALSFPCYGAKKQKIYSKVELSLITRLTAKILEACHYSQITPDVKLSKKIFKKYIDTLDPVKMYITQEDIKSVSVYENLLSNHLTSGTNDFAFSVYRIYRNRLGEYKKFAESRLKKPFDFSKDEEYNIDRDKLPRPANKKELYKLWEQRLKSDVLYNRLVARALKEEFTKATAEEKKNLDIIRRWEGKTPEEKVLKRLRDINNEVRKKEAIDILGIYLDSVAKVHGAHSNYMSPKADEDFEIHMQLSLSGIGATLTSDDGFIKVVNLLKGGPAAKDGRLKVEDRIIAVTGEDGETVDVIDMPVSKAVQYIRGKEGSKVTLTVLPGSKGRNASPVNIQLTRAKFKLEEEAAKSVIKNVKVDNKNLKIGVLTLPGFYNNCGADVKRILQDFNKNQVDGVILDMRKNGGGLLYEAIKISGYFMKSGPVVQVRSNDRKVRVESDDDGKAVYLGPLVVLVSKLSASSSEIVTAALRDNKRCVVVGDSRTFGKGTVLGVQSLDRFLTFRGITIPAGSLIFETSVFYRPSGGSVQQLGIFSDIKLPSLTEELKVGEMFLENHLSWDSIPVVKQESYNKNLISQIPLLRKKSMERIKKDLEYKKYLKQIETFKRYRDKKVISLNEEKRWKEYSSEKEATDNTENLLSNDDKKQDKSSDCVLNEAVNIAADYVLMH